MVPQSIRFDELDSITMRKEPFAQPLPTLGLITDASPRGIGAILFEIDQESGNLHLAAVESAVSKDDAKWPVVLGNTMYRASVHSARPLSCREPEILEATGDDSW